MERLLNLVKRSKISKNNLHLVVGAMIGISLTFGGYGLVKNIKSEQSAQAEQLPGTPDSGVKSRITELYDALVAQNKGSDTDVSGLTAAPGDWGPKWNRIKTAALRNGSGGGDNGSYNQHREFIDGITGLEWSYPLVRKGNQVTTHPGDYSIWSWDASYSNNQAVGNKTAAQLCQVLGDNWRLPTKNELSTAYNYVNTRRPEISHRDSFRWSSTEFESHPQYAWDVRWSDGYAYTSGKTLQTLVSCVR